VELQQFKASPLENHRKHGGKAHDPRRCRLGLRGGCPEKPCRNPPSLRDRVLSRAFSEELESLVHAGSSLYLDPRGHLINLWHKIFLTACLLSLFVDPMFLYLTGTQKNMCVEFKYSLGLTLSMIRSLMDLLYAAHILIRFRTAFIAPSSRVFGRGELVIQPHKIARRYLSRTFWLDLVTALPLPQVLYFGARLILLAECSVNKSNMSSWDAACSL
jgi:cyclic nucleotide gated channel, plant